MQFICSVNSKVVSALDAATGKIEAGGDFRSFNNNWEPVELDALGIADEVGQQRVCARGTCLKASVSKTTLASSTLG